MDRLYLGYPNDAEVDALLSQLNDESLLKLKVNTHKTTSGFGFEYPTFTDGWENEDDDALDDQLASRFSSLKLPVAPAKKKTMGGKRGSNLDRAGKRGRDSRSIVRSAAEWEALGKEGRNSHMGSRRGRDLPPGVRKGRNLEAVGEEDEEGEEEEEETNPPSSGIDDASSRKQLHHHRQRKGPASSESLSQTTEFLSCKKSTDNLAAAAANDDDDDLDNIDALLHERFRALKAPPTPPPPASPSSRNVGLENLRQFAGQQHRSSTNDYESFGPSFSTPSSPSAKLLGRSVSRSSPRVLTNSVSSSCHCSSPSPLKLLRQVGSKSFPSKQRLPPIPPAPPSSSASGKKSSREYKKEAFGNSKSVAKESDKPKKEKKDKVKKEKAQSAGNEMENNNSNPSSVKDMRRLLSSVADRVGLERSRVSSAEEDDFLGDDDLQSWSVLDGDDEFARVSTEEENLNREAERVVEWAKDAARLGMGTADSDGESEAGEFKRVDDDDGDDDDDSGGSVPSDVSSKKDRVQVKEGGGAKVVEPKKKKWGLF